MKYVNKENKYMSENLTPKTIMHEWISKFVIVFLSEKELIVNNKRYRTKSRSKKIRNKIKITKNTRKLLFNTWIEPEREKKKST